MIKILNNITFSTLALLLLAGCGGSSSSTTPTTIPSSATIFYAHNLVFRNSTSSTLLSTGYNGFGQLGSGDLANRSAPGFLSGNFTFKGFATGGDHSVAFMNNSTVRSWGYNGFGQLGIANLSTHGAVPVKTVGISGVTAVAAGAYHTLALDNNGTLWAWGSNGAGQLGVDSLLASLGYSTIPLRVNAGGIVLSNISSIAANGYNSMALANGRVWAWGLNTSGQLGMDPAITGALASPIPVPGLSSTVISGIAAGGAFNYAIAGVDGSVWAWGCNDNGQLGDGQPVGVTPSSSFTPVQVLKADGTALTGVVQVAAGIQHGLARLSDGSVWAWGFNFFGQLGQSASNPLDSHYAVQVKDAAGTGFLTGASDIRAFGSSSMAMVGGKWYVWGNNSFGQLGIGVDGTQATIIPLPVKMFGF